MKNNINRKKQGVKQKTLVLLTTIILTVICCCGCGERNSETIYKSAVRKLARTDINEEGTYEVTKYLITALEHVEFTEPKNIIYMIGDGMGSNIIEATQQTYAQNLYGNKLAINYLANVGTQSTYSANDAVTDSAAGGTALSTGRKTSNGTIAMNATHTEDYQTVLELAAENGKSTGIIAKKTVVDATPASFTAHVTDRSLKSDIARQQLEKISDGSLDLVLGGGTLSYEEDVNSEVFEEAKQNGMSYSTDWEHATKDELPLVGLFAEEHMDTFDDNLPTLAEMTEFALERLSEDEHGFFLMVEGSQIDTNAHANELENEIHEMYQFDAAIAVAMKFVAMHPDTVIVVTADHETGGLHMPKDGLGEEFSHSYLTENHTSINVPVYALGYGIEALEGIKENVDVAGFIASLLGVQDFEIDSKITGLFDAQDSEVMKLSFDKDTKFAELLTDEMVSKMNQTQNVRAIHMVVRNIGTDKVTLPVLRITTASSLSYDSAPQFAYIDAGKTMELTYVLHIDLWKDKALHNVTEMQLTSKVTIDTLWKSTFGYSGEALNLEITEISLTDRQLDN